MVDWNVWTSTDLVNWKHVTTISLNQTYMKDSPTLRPLQSVLMWRTQTVRLIQGPVLTIQPAYSGAAL